MKHSQVISRAAFRPGRILATRNSGTAKVPRPRGTKAGTSVTMASAVTSPVPKPGGHKPSPALDFVLPPELEAHEPPEARGLAADGVRLLVSHWRTNQISHANFSDLGQYLRPGDLLVVNTSGTLNAALPARRADGTNVELHLSTRLPDGAWSVELRQWRGHLSLPFLTASAGETLQLPAGGSLQLIERYAPSSTLAPRPVAGTRLWRATLSLSDSLLAYLERHGSPIRYSYVPRAWPAQYYQTVFANEMGSAEMPSAGRGFTPQLVTRLVSQGIAFAPLLLHTGVASLEDHEPPYAEYYRVPAETARAVNLAKAAGQRVIAVGTTAIRALETVTDAEGTVHGGSGWTDLVISPSRGIRAASALLTGFHEPRASHLMMLEALANREHLSLAYQASLNAGYLWHEFGDLHLLMP